MRTMKIWKIVFVMLAAISFASCNSDDNVERRLTTNQKERYAQNISGEYSGEYIIIYKDKDCTDMTDEKGRKQYSATCNLMCPTTRCSMYSFKTSPFH